MSVGWLGQILEVFEKVWFEKAEGFILRRTWGISCAMHVYLTTGSTLFVYNFGLGCIACGEECGRCWTSSFLSVDASRKAIFTEV